MRARDWVERNALALALTIGAVVRLAALGSAPSSLDETWSYAFARSVLDRGEFLETLRTGLDAPLFAAINVTVARLMGLNMFSLRLPMAAAGILVLPFIYDLVRRWQSPSLAGWGVLLCAVNPFLVYYSRTARPYALMLLCCVLVVWVHQRFCGRARFVIVPIAMLSAVASHYYALVFLATFFALIVWRDWEARDFERLREGLGLATAGLILCAPMLAAVFLRLGTLSVPYWALADITLPSLAVEQWLMLGTALGPPTLGRSVLTVALAALLLAPLILDSRRSELHVVLRHGWWMPYALVLVAGATLGMDLLFYARGFIAATPFALVSWLHGTARLRGWVQLGYLTLSLSVMVASTAMVASSSPRHPYYRGRAELEDIVRRVESHRSRYDLLVVHHWWMSMVFERYAADPLSVVPLNVARVSVAPQAAWAGALAALDELPSEARIALVLNDLATEFADPASRVVRALESRRPRRGTAPCTDTPSRGTRLVCTKVIFFGPETADAPGDDAWR